MKINEYIESGILEAYVLGSASEAEAKELLNFKKQYPQVEEALYQLELDLERIAEHMAITPPPNTWDKIESGINELMELPSGELLIGDAPPRSRDNNSRSKRSAQFIEVESESGHMRIRKGWRWVFAAVFLLGKIFLAFAIYFYLESRQSEKEIKRLETELRYQKTH